MEESLKAVTARRKHKLPATTEVIIEETPITIKESSNPQKRKR